MSDYPGEPGPRREPDRSDDRREADETTRPLGWGAGDPPRGWDTPDARPQGYDTPAYATPPPFQPPAQPPYAGGPPQGWVPYGVPVVDHPRSNLAMVLGIVGLVGGLTCGIGFLLSPVAWLLGRSSVREIRASGGHYGGEGQARAGQVLGIIGTVLLVLGLLAIVGFVLFLFLVAGSGDTGYTNV